MRTTCRKVHNYLGVTLDYQNQGKVKIEVINYTKDIIKISLEPIEGSVTTTDADHLFVVNEDRVN
eukprot:11417603-Ditylum_brightwellii.AAC.1